MTLSLDDAGFPPSPVPVEPTMIPKRRRGPIIAVVVVAIGIYRIRVWSDLEKDTRKVEQWAEAVSAKADKERELTLLAGQLVHDFVELRQTMIADARAEFTKRFASLR